MFARLLLIPFLVLALGGLYLSWEVSSNWSWIIILCVVTGAAIYIFSPQINWWWYLRHPKDLDTPLVLFFEQYDHYYRALSPIAKVRFRQRVFLFQMGNDFMPQGWDSVPDDVQIVIAAAAVKIRFYEQEILFPNCERIIVYPTAFPTPEYPTEWHSSEWFPEDGVVLFAADAVMLAMVKPTRQFDLPLYEYWRVNKTLHATRSALPSADPWPEIKLRTGWDQAAICQMIGLQDVDGEAVLAAISFQPLFIQGLSL